MKGSLILCNALSVVAYLLWLGWQFLKGLGRAYSNPNSSTGPGDIYWVFVVLGIATLGCVIGSFLVPAGAARFVAAAPLALILLGQGFITYQEKTRFAAYRREGAARVAARVQKLGRISRDFVRKADPRESELGHEASFLTHDRELNTLVLIDVSYDAIVTAFSFGKLNGAVLETMEPVEGRKSYYQQYVDAEGKSVFDRYTLKHRPGQDYKDYRLERYDTGD